MGYCEGALWTERDVNDTPERIIARGAAHRIGGEQTFLGLEGARQQSQHDGEVLPYNPKCENHW